MLFCVLLIDPPKGDEALFHELVNAKFVTYKLEISPLRLIYDYVSNRE